MTAYAAEAALALAIDAAREAGALLIELGRSPATGIRSKSSATDLVSEADERAERAIVTAIRRRRPEDALVAEEGSSAPGSSGVSWYIDPLDGTINYLYGIPHWSVSICCADTGGPLAAVVFDPVRDELFSATRGGGARLGQRSVYVSEQTNLGSALVATGFDYEARYRVKQGLVAAAVLPHVRDIRRAGSAALDLAWVAAGRLDAYFETGVMPWDVAAGTLLVREAGGIMTDVDGIGADRRPGVVASNAHIHDTLRMLLSRAN